MKAAVLAVCREATIVDLTHGIRPQDIREGAIVLARVAPQFPEETIHVAVVDPGVGTERRLVCARLGPHWCIGPDNGLWSRLALWRPPESFVSIENSQYRRPEVSSTFHGRDIMAPAAGHLALGVEASLLGPPLEGMVTLDWRLPTVSPGVVEGVVEYIDSFGNLVTNLPREALEKAGLDESASVLVADRSISPILRTYGQSAPGQFVALFGSSGQLEIAVVNGSAAKRFGIGPGDRITVQAAQ
jgi:S-adenosylmethionine hydrolase